ncbi:low temperature requirement protein A [Carboxylicivirga linearis]|uniref:Low temperature requirement protein A n=1 Tax=Carboxylicivirga linearis TaxID=1628157 RepID=A0ABS5JQL1_9BACT|nr:low temperature requirement protein A [Carboxylicivirga linearis]MBS2096766.1 low temperature requirement protein A [Carboxylicivirga linearis]
MGTNHYRYWWQKPKRYAVQEEDRKVSFLELFYDLIYVAIIAQLSHKLAVDVSWSSFGEFSFLFLVVWWGWYNGAIYHDLHGNNDIKTRVVTFLQMFAVTAIAVFIHNAFTDGAIGFIISYSIFLLIITVLWYRTGYHDPDHKPLANPYALSYLISIMLMLASIFVDTSLRFYLWYISFGIIVIQPLLLYTIGLNNTKIQTQIDKSIGLSPSIRERFGLITIIVLGEVVVGVVNGLISSHHLDLINGLIAFLSMSLGVGIWWVYFDYISNQKPKSNHIIEHIWGYLHMPLTLGITTIGAATINITAVGNQVESPVRLLLTGGIAIVYISISFMFFTLRCDDKSRKLNRVGQVITALAGIISILLYFLRIEMHLLLLLLDIVLLAPIYFGFRIWIRQYIKNINEDNSIVE